MATLDTDKEMLKKAEIAETGMRIGRQYKCLFYMDFETLYVEFKGARSQEALHQFMQIYSYQGA